MASSLTGVLAYLLSVFPLATDQPVGGGVGVLTTVATAAFLHNALE